MNNNKEKECMSPSEVKFAGLFEHMPSGVAVYKAVDDGESFVFADLNPAAEKIENLRKSDVIGKRLDHLFPGVHELGLTEALRRVWKSGKAEYLPKSLYKDEHRESWRENWIYRLHTGEVVALYNDVTSRIKAEEEVESQKNLFKNLITNIPYAVFWKNRSSAYFGCNDNFARIAGVKSSEEIFGKTDYELPWTKGESDVFTADDKRVMDGGVSMLNIERTLRQADGREVSILASKVPLRDNKGNVVGLMGIYNDITERKHAEAILQKAYDDLRAAQTDLVQSEKMAAIGRFSAGIAHEVKNPLAIIVGCAELLENKMPHYDMDAMDTLEKIKDSALRANSILVSLLQYARPSELKTEVSTSKELIEGVLPLFEKRAHEANVDIIKDFSPEHIRIAVDKNQLHQVLFNIIKNALEAMPEGGKITIKTYKAVMPELSYSFPSCVIELKDTGMGISKDNLSKIAEPFFSTKPRVAGTGLGLFMGKSIMDKHRGKLLVDSEPGHGTTIKVVLPILRD